MALTKKETVAALQLIRTHILLQAGVGGMDAAVAAALRVGIATVGRVRNRFVSVELNIGPAAREGVIALKNGPGAALISRCRRTSPS
jgi:hypothetical protein